MLSDWLPTKKKHSDWSRKKKGLPVARVISHFDLSLPGTFFHEHWIGPRLLSFQMGNYLVSHILILASY